MLHRRNETYFTPVLPVSLIRPHLFLVVIKHPVPEVTVPSCKVVLEFVPASYAINSLLNVCGHFASLQLVFPATGHPD